MSEGVGPAAEAPRARGPIRNPREFWGGLSLIVLAGIALWASSDLPGMRGFAFGPGTAPRLFAYILMGLGVGVLLTGLFTDGPPAERYAVSGPFGGGVLVVVVLALLYYSKPIATLLPFLPADVAFAAVTVAVIIPLALLLTRIAPRGPVLITASTLIFAVTIRPLGLVITSYVSLIVAAAGSDEIRWLETAIWAAILTAFCAFLFPYALNLPLQLWPRF